MSLSAPSSVLVALLALASGVALAPEASAKGATHAAEPSAGATMSGFETLADGSTRLFVELSKPVTYETKAAKGSVTYVLKGARVLKRNNTNPLVTVHFNTPVTQARLVPHGHDLWFILDLRASVEPSVSMDAGKDGSAVMHVALPKGDYLPAGGAAPPGGDSEPPPAGSATPPSH